MPETISDRTVVPLNPSVAKATKEGVAEERDQTHSALEQKSAGVASTPDRGIQRVTDGVIHAVTASESLAEVPGQSDPHPPDARQPSRLKNIQIGKLDSREVEISHIYAAQADEYVIYRAGEVMVHFADDQARMQAQKKAIFPLSSARAEVNALMQGLTCCKVFNQQLAYALQLALDGDLDGAKVTIAAARAAVLAKRAARGRFQYLKWSYGAAGALVGLLFIASRFYPFQDPSSDLWLAAKAGAVGAAFSIALAIRARTVALDIDLLDNVTDGTLRLIIGVISAGILLLLFKCGIVPSLKIGDADFKATALTWEMVLVIGFLGGFLERLVPDLLEKRNSQSNGGNGSREAAVTAPQ
jgi:hypothetical protein